MPTLLCDAVYYGDPPMHGRGGWHAAIRVVGAAREREREMDD